MFIIHVIQIYLMEYWNPHERYMKLNANKMDDKKHKLWDLCKKFIEEHEIGHPECIYQGDNVILNAQEFIEDICDIVGYHEHKEDE